MVLQKEGVDQLDRSLRNEEVLHRVQDDRYILHTIKRKKANWICHILRTNPLKKHTMKERQK